MNIKQYCGLRVAVLSLLVALSACSSMKTQVYVSDDVTLGGWQTYSWSSPPIAVEGSLFNDLAGFDYRLRVSVDKEMAAKGYRRSKPGDVGDISLDYRIGSESHISSQEFASPIDYLDRAFALPGELDGVNSQFYSQHNMGFFQIKGIILTVLDRKSQRIVWQGVAKKLVKDSSPSKKSVDRYIEKAIKRLFRELPNAK